MINDQITDSVTQLIKYKDGMGGGQPSKIILKFVNEEMTYDDALSKYINPNEPHLPTIEECDILHHYMGGRMTEDLVLTRELRNDTTVTCANLRQRIYIGTPRKDKHRVILTYIEYMV